MLAWAAAPGTETLAVELPFSAFGLEEQRAALGKQAIRRIIRSLVKVLWSLQLGKPNPKPTISVAPWMSTDWLT